MTRGGKEVTDRHPLPCYKAVALEGSCRTRAWSRARAPRILYSIPRASDAKKTAPDVLTPCSFVPVLDQ